MSEDRAIKRIMVFNPSFLGDSVLTVPLIKKIKELYAESILYFVVRPEYVNLFSGLPYINGVISYDKRGRESGIGGLMRFISKIKLLQIDILINCHKSFRSSMFTLLSGIKTTVGFKQSVMRFIYDMTVSRDMTLHEIDRNISLLSKLSDGKAVKSRGLLPEISVDAEYKRKAELFIKSSIGKDAVLLGVNPTSVWKTKIWPAEYYASLINRVYRENNIVSILFAAPNETVEADEVIKNIEVPFINMSGRTKLIEVSSLLSFVDIFVTNDSGPLHMAVAFNKPIVAVFGPTVKGLGFYPYNDKSVVVENSNLSCRPCGLHGGKKCPEGHFKCMVDIAPDTVYNEIIKLLKNEGK